MRCVPFRLQTWVKRLCKENTPFLLFFFSAQCLLWYMLKGKRICHTKGTVYKKKGKRLLQCSPLAQYYAGHQEGVSGVLWTRGDRQTLHCRVKTLLENNCIIRSTARYTTLQSLFLLVHRVTLSVTTWYFLVALVGKSLCTYYFTVTICIPQLAACLVTVCLPREINFP